MNKNKITLTIVAAITVTCLAGCGTTAHETYKQSGYTPDGFNYTFAADHQGMKPAQHYFGLSWSLK